MNFSRRSEGIMKEVYYRRKLVCAIGVFAIMMAGFGPIPVYSQLLSTQGLPIAGAQVFEGGVPITASPGGTEVGQKVDAAGTSLRIGLRSRGESNSIEIHSTTLDIGFHTDGYFRTEATLHAYGRFSAVRAQAAYVRVGENLQSFEQARSAAENAQTGGHRAIPVLVSPSNWSVYVGGFSSVGEAESAAGQLGGTAVASSQTRIAISDGAYPIVIFDNSGGFAQFADPSGITSIDSGRYRGVIEPFVQGGRFTAVNIVNIEDYLLSVVPSEMPASWHIEALKAQAVAARTYALSRHYVHLAEGFQLCDTIFTQVYRGVEMEHENSTRAVNETRGMMAFYDGRPIEAVYFSSSGGHTEDSENVWITSVPYLRAVREVAETDYMEWTRSFTMAQLTGFMAASGHNIGSVTSVGYRRSSSSGRVIEITFVGTNGSRTYTNDAIRGAFRHSADGSLQSTNFSIANSVSTASAQDPAPADDPDPATPAEDGYIVVSDVHGARRRIPIAELSGVFGAELLIRDATAPSAANTQASASAIVTDILHITGRGWGHGAGMSQFGARGMAEAGFTFDQILKHYYTGIEVR